MADLLTPKTWTSGEVPTAANMNSGIRDPINRLNGFADNITNSTAADSGSATYLKITRPGAFATVLEGWTSGESFARVQLTTGSLYFGDGTATPNHALEYDDNIPGIKTLGIFQTRDLHINTGPLLFTGTPNTSLNQYIELTAMAAIPTAPAAQHARLFLLSSSGQQRFCCLFSSGPAVVIATMP